MIYKDKALWTHTTEIPNKDFEYSYVVLDDFDPNAVPNWEPCLNRTLRKNQIPTIDDWGVYYYLSTFVYSLLFCEHKHFVCNIFLTLKKNVTGW